MTDVYGLTREAAMKVKELVNAGDPRLYPDINPTVGGWVFMCYGKSDEAISQGSSGDVTVYTRGSSFDDAPPDKGDETASDQTVTAYSRLADLPSGKWCYLFYMGGGWEVVNAECS